MNKRTRFEHAARAAEILAGMFAATYANPTWRAEFGDQHCFDQLRLDPYYRFTATRHPDLAGQFKERIEACRKQGCALVHGDYSPKNFLVSEDAGREMMLIDFEVIHFGDPSFDAAFLLNHLLLKLRHGIAACRDLALHFWRVLSESIHLDWFERSTLLHLGCLHLARVDGKSPAEYLTGEEREVVRRAAREMILEPRESVEEVFR